MNYLTITAYYFNNKFVYAKLAEEHFTIDRKWSKYITLRKDTPKKVTIYKNLTDLKEKLLAEKGVLI